jgi:hypothetical protein
MFEHTEALVQTAIASTLSIEMIVKFNSTALSNSFYEADLGWFYERIWKSKQKYDKSVD